VEANHRDRDEAVFGKEGQAVVAGKAAGNRYLLGFGSAVLVCTLAIVAAAPPAVAARRPASVTTSHPSGYKIVSSGSISAAPSTFDTGGSVACPTGTVVWGGGASFVGGFFGPSLTVNTSEPMESAGWEARVNNTGTSTAQFAVDAICAKKPKGYKIVFQDADNPADTQSQATAICPSPKVVLGGGTLSTSDQAPAVLTSAWPASSDKFTGYMYNGTSADAELIVYAVCGDKPAGYAIASNSASFASGSTLLDGIACPSGTSALDGGAKTSGHSPLVQVGGSIDQGAFGWSITMNNTAPSEQQVHGYVICAA
jgi:hypothetical protein